MSFATGLQMGFTEQQRARDNRRADELHALQTAELRRRAAQEAALDTAYNQYADTFSQGAQAPGVTAPIQGRYGMTPEQQAAYGSGLQEKLREFDVPDSYDLQTTPEGAPSANIAHRARGVDVEAAKQRNLLGARQKINSLSRNAAGLAAGEAEGRAIDMQEDMRRIPGMLTDELFRKNLNKFINEQNPRVTVSRQKDPKTGKEVGPYVVTLVDPNGEGKMIPLSDTQYMQLAEAHVRAARGDIQGASATARLVNKEIAEAIEGYNNHQLKTGQVNEQGRHNYSQEEIARMRAEQEREYQRGSLSIQRAQHPTLPPEMAKLLDSAIQSYHSATTPEERQRARSNYEMLLARASVALGRPGRIGAEPKPPIPFKDWMEMSLNSPSAMFRDKGGNAIPIGKLNPQQVQAEYELAMRGNDQGGAPDFPRAAPASARNEDYGNEARRGPPAPNIYIPPELTRFSEQIRENWQSGRGLLGMPSQR